LLIQAYAMRNTIVALQKEKSYWRTAYLERSKADLAHAQDRLDSELTANHLLTEALLAAEARIEELEET
jgi:hypothetical protein